MKICKGLNICTKLFHVQPGLRFACDESSLHNVEYHTKDLSVGTRFIFLLPCRLFACNEQSPHNTEYPARGVEISVMEL